MLRCLILALVLGAAAANAVPALAQFYDLDGTYHCLTAATPDESCKKGEKSQPPAALKPPPPDVASAIGRIIAGSATAADIAAIEKQAAAKEPRAVEALAWCKLNGIGMTEDPVAAYWLYGEAAQLGIPTAESNQVAIFETRMSHEQRQLVLMGEQRRR